MKTRTASTLITLAVASVTFLAGIVASPWLESSAFDPMIEYDVVSPDGRYRARIVSGLKTHPPFRERDALRLCVERVVDDGGLQVLFCVTVDEENTCYVDHFDLIHWSPDSKEVTFLNCIKNPVSFGLPEEHPTGTSKQAE